MCFVWIDRRKSSIAFVDPIFLEEKRFNIFYKESDLPKFRKLPNVRELLRNVDSLYEQ